MTWETLIAAAFIPVTAVVTWWLNRRGQEAAQTAQIAKASIGAVDVLQAAMEQLKQELEKLTVENDRLAAEIIELRATISRLRPSPLADLGATLKARIRKDPDE